MTSNDETDEATDTDAIEAAQLDAALRHGSIPTMTPKELIHRLLVELNAKRGAVWEYTIQNPGNVEPYSGSADWRCDGRKDGGTDYFVVRDEVTAYLVKMNDEWGVFDLQGVERVDHFIDRVISADVYQPKTHLHHKT